jgi:hypothetical protein
MATRSDSPSLTLARALRDLVDASGLTKSDKFSAINLARILIDLDDEGRADVTPAGPAAATPNP